MTPRGSAVGECAGLSLLQPRTVFRRPTCRSQALWYSIIRKVRLLSLATKRRMAQSLPANKRKYLRTSQYVYTSSFLARLFSKASPRRATSSVNPPRNAKRSAVFFKPVSRDHPSQEFSLYRNTELSRVLRSLKLEYRKFKLVSAKQRRFVRRDLLSSLPRLNENIRPFPEKATYPSGTRSLSSTTVFSGAQAGHGLWLRFKNPVGGPTTWARSQVNSRISRLSLYY